MCEKCKLAYLVGRVCENQAEIFDALGSEYFEWAEDVLHSFIDNCGEYYDSADQEILDLCYKRYLKMWEVTNDTTRN